MSLVVQTAVPPCFMKMKNRFSYGRPPMRFAEEHQSLQALVDGLLRDVEQGAIWDPMDRVRLVYPAYLWRI
jgi:hypothetical protein